MWHRATYIVVLHKSSDEDEDEDVRVIVQKRSNLKDYCPGKYDPAPGGVVGFGESYETNVVRELEEEMGITKENMESMRRLFTFQYQDDNVKCWGDLWEVVFVGDVDSLELQEEEVEEIVTFSVDELDSLVNQSSGAEGEWMPDGLHAIRLYLQYKHDVTVKRRQYIDVGLSSCGNLESYRLRPKIEAIFFDCDDCLYFDEWKVANMLTSKIELWFNERNFEKGYAYELYKKYGTALKGLQAEHLIEDCEDAVDEYLREVHDIGVDKHLKRDENLRAMLEKIDPSIQKYIFTASVKHHAERCLEALGIRDLFIDIIDVKACNLATKHTKEAFSCAMKVAGITDPFSCLFLDDSLKNISMGAKMGWRCILVGLKGRDCGKAVSSNGAAEHEISRIHELENVMPEIFVNEQN